MARMHAIPQQTSDSARHQSAIEALARETRAEPARVRALYERELAQLGANAKVHGYLFVLARRNVKAKLREAAVTSHAPRP
jgi:cell division septum initiation protein DivIVA